MAEKFQHAIAHIGVDGQFQSVKVHLENVAGRAFDIGKAYGIENAGFLLGILHDLGKITNEFQRYIRSDDNSSQKGKIDHSTYGAKLIYELCLESDQLLDHLTSEALSMCIMSHHGGLQDFLQTDGGSNFLKRNLEKDLIEYDLVKKAFFAEILSEENLRLKFDLAKQEIEKLLQKLKNNDGQRSSFYSGLVIKLLFSVLIEADRSDTIRFMSGIDGNELALAPDWPHYIDALERRLEGFKVRNRIDAERKNISDECREFADNLPGVYDLTVPTGSGKTLASLRYALYHAQKFNKAKIFFILPYTTIIEQNAAAVRDILGDEAVIEHHSNVGAGNDDGYGLSDEIRRTSQINWDAPIIFTTMVQFLNVFYESGTRSIRRLHELGDAVIIFDEVQVVPLKTIHLFNEVVNFLVKIMSSTVVLSTATQPTLEAVPKAISKPINHSMIKNVAQKFQTFKRVEIDVSLSKKYLEQTEVVDLIMQDIKTKNSVMMVVNLTKTARQIFQGLQEKVGAEVELIHLSTKMCPAHRKAKIKELNQLLDQKKKVICVTTQLIEAGVDISFERVYRSLTGIASIAQAAGRCNRHGECQKMGEVSVLRINNDYSSHLPEIQIGADITSALIDDGVDLLSAEGVARYFKQFYASCQQKFDYDFDNSKHEEVKNTNQYELLSSNPKGINALRSRGVQQQTVFRQAFRTAARHFGVIENRTTSVLVPYGAGRELIADLLGNRAKYVLNWPQINKQAQQFIVNLYDYELQTLQRENLLIYHQMSGLFILKESAYNQLVGVDFDGESMAVAMF